MSEATAPEEVEQPPSSALYRQDGQMPRAKVSAARLLPKLRLARKGCSDTGGRINGSATSETGAVGTRHARTECESPNGVERGADPRIVADKLRRPTRPQRPNGDGWLRRSGGYGNAPFRWGCRTMPVALDSPKVRTERIV